MVELAAAAAAAMLAGLLRCVAGGLSEVAEAGAAAFGSLAGGGWAAFGFLLPLTRLGVAATAASWPVADGLRGVAALAPVGGDGAADRLLSSGGVVAVLGLQGALTRRLGRALPLGRDELAALAELEAAGERPAAAGADLLRPGPEGGALLLRRGWACSYLPLAGGGGRRLVDLLVPGELAGLQGLAGRSTARRVAALTPVVVTELPYRRLEEVCRQRPRLGAAILLAGSRDAAAAVERLVRRGGHALGRAARLLLELGGRLEAAGLGQKRDFACPVDPAVLAETAGLAPAELDEVLAQLQERGLATLREGRVTVHDAAGLRALADSGGGRA